MPSSFLQQPAGRLEALDVRGDLGNEAHASAAIKGPV
jgi:hypothetical protein